MARPYSTDLRKRAVSAVIGGDTTRVVADRFGIAVSSVVKWHQRFRRTGSVEPSQMGGHRKRILDPERDFIIDQIKRTPHLTIRGLKTILAGRGIAVSRHAVWTFLHREGLSFKKKLCLVLNRLVSM